jgi:hypothetical protein
MLKNQQSYVGQVGERISVADVGPKQARSFVSMIDLFGSLAPLKSSSYVDACAQTQEGAFHCSRLPPI